MSIVNCCRKVQSTYILFGGNGYYGYNFIKYLTQQSHPDTYINIIVIDKVEAVEEVEDIDLKISFLKFDLAYHTYPDGKPYTTIDIIKAINGKIAAAGSVGALNGPIYLINFAAESFVDTSIKQPKITLQNNIYEAITFCKIATACRRIKGSKIIHISTDEVNNKFEKVIFQRSAYSVSKDVIEEIILNQVPETIILRPSNLFGCFDYTDKKCIQRNPCVVKNLVNGIYEIHNKSVSRRFIHINEACQTLQALCLGQECPNLDLINVDMDWFNKLHIYIFNDDTEFNIAELIEYVAKRDDAIVINLDGDPRTDFQDYDYNTYYEIQGLEIIERTKTKTKKLSLEDVYEEIKRMRETHKANPTIEV